MAHQPPMSRGFLTNPHHRDRQDDRHPTNAREGVRRLELNEQLVCLVIM